MSTAGIMSFVLVNLLSCFLLEVLICLFYYIAQRRDAGATLCHHLLLSLVSMMQMYIYIFVPKLDTAFHMCVLQSIDLLILYILTRLPCFTLHP